MTNEDSALDRSVPGSTDPSPNTVGSMGSPDQTCLTGGAADHANREIARYRFRQPAERLAFSGERYVTGLGGSIQYEHYHRYLFAAPFCRGKAVLDVACGEGYGCAMLADVAASVVGVDVDVGTVDFATRQYQRDNLQFLTSDATKIPLPDASIDVITSFETIEHLHAQAEFLDEICRLLRPDGCLVISSPNRTVYSELHDYKNPFHVLEFDREEFRTLLSARFKNVRIHEQRWIAGCVISVEPSSAAPVLGLESTDGTTFAEHAGLPNPEYFVALASNAELPAGRISVMFSGSPGQPSEVQAAGSDSQSEPRTLEDLCREAASSLNVSDKVHDNDPIFRFLIANPAFSSTAAAVSYYFNDGANSARKIRRAIEKYVPAQGARRILEFASGYGPVTRHAVRELAQHELHACDTHPDAVAFLQGELGAKSLLSSAQPQSLVFPVQYDFIYALSFFSHVPDRTWGDWIRRLVDALVPDGVLLFTTHGRISRKFFPDAVLDERGYWFSGDGGGSEPESADRGQAITSLGYVESRISEIENCEMICFEQAGWWDHQDVYVLRKLDPPA